MFRRWLEGYAGFVTRRPWWVLCALAIFALVCALCAMQLEFKSSYVDLLPDDAPELESRDEVMGQVKGTTELILSIEGGDAAGREAFARAAVERLQAAPDSVLSARVEFPVDFFESRWLYLLPVEKLDELRALIREAREVQLAEEISANVAPDDGPDPWARLDALGDELKGTMGLPLGREGRGVEALDEPLPRMVTSGNGERLFALIQPAGTIGEFDRTREVFEDIERIVSETDPEKYGVKAQIAGRMPITIEEHDQLAGDMMKATLIALALVVLLMIVMTRQLSTLVVVGAPLVLGIAATLAVTALTIGHLNMISGFMVPALVGLGVDFCIHLHLRFRDTLATGVSREAAMAEAIVAMFPPCLASAATTSVAFLALLVNDFEGISEYGLVASYGVMITLLVTFVALPPLGLLLAGAAPIKRETWLPSMTRTMASTIVVASLSLAVFAGWSAQQDVGFRNDFEKLRGVSASNDVYNDVAEELGGPIDPSLIMVPDTETARRVEGVIRDLKAAQPRGMATNFGRVASLASMVPEEDPARPTAIKQLRRELRYLNNKKGALTEDQRAQLDVFTRLAKAQPWSDRAQPWSEAELPEFFRERFLSRDGQRQFVLFWKHREINHDHELVAWSNQVEALSQALSDAKLEAKVLDEASVTARVIKLLRRDFPLMIVLAIGGVLLIIIVTFRRASRVLLVTLSLGAGVATMLGVMAWVGVDFNLFNVVVLPSIVGIGIDNAVHMMHGYDELGPGRVRELLMTRGRAAALSSATTGIGFGTMVIAHHHGVYTLGAVAIVGVASTFFFTTLILPALLQALEQRAPLAQSSSS